MLRLSNYQIFLAKRAQNVKPQSHEREWVQSGMEDAKGDGEPSNAFPSEPNSTRTGFISKAL